MERKSSWTEQDLTNLIGLPESSRREYKDSRLFEKNPDEVAKDLSKEVSAFANSEGGIIFIGVKETKGKSRVAEGIDGVDPNQWPRERLQQIVEGNLSPYLPGIRFYSVPLSGPHQGHMAYIIDVPAGSTAYQAKDRLYYGRSEFEAKALPDHEIRLRMMRGRVAQARLDVIDCCRLTADEEWDKRNAEIQSDRVRFNSRRVKELRDVPKRTFDEYSIQFGIRNVGDLTIYDLVLFVTLDARFQSNEQRYRLVGDRKETYELGHTKKIPAPPKIFPSDRLTFPKERMIIHVPHAMVLAPSDVILNWTIYLDDAPPSFGEFTVEDLGIRSIENHLGRVLMQ